MSRIGKRPVALPKGVQATVTGQTVKVKGPKGELALTLVSQIAVKMGDGGIEVTPREETKIARAMWGMSRTLIHNMVVGVTDGYSKALEIQGVGFRAALKGKELNLQVGYSHEINHPIPAGVTVTVPKPTEITITGIDKQKVGQLAAELRRYRPPEPYQGKGVRYKGEFVFRKEGKKK